MRATDTKASEVNNDGTISLFYVFITKKTTHVNERIDCDQIRRLLTRNLKLLDINIKQNCQSDVWWMRKTQVSVPSLLFCCTEPSSASAIHSPLHDLIIGSLIWNTWVTNSEGYPYPRIRNINQFADKHLTSLSSNKTTDWRPITSFKANLSRRFSNGRSSSLLRSSNSLFLVEALYGNRECRY